MKEIETDVKQRGKLQAAKDTAQVLWLASSCVLVWVVWTYP